MIYRAVPALLVTLLLGLAGCGGARPRASVVPPTPPTPGVPSGSAGGSAGATVSGLPSTTGAHAPPRDPQVVAWGRDGSLVSIVVRNVDARQIEEGLVRIALYDRGGRMLLSTTGLRGSKCCTLLSVPPGHRFGLFLTARGVGPIAQVRVAFAHPSQVRTRPWPASSRPRIRVTDARFVRTSHDAVVTATFEPRRTVPAYVAGQAFLVDRRGHLVAVISGRFYCFDGPQRHQVRMALQHRVPPGTRLGTVVAYPIPPRVRPHVPYSCTSEKP